MSPVKNDPYSLLEQRKGFAEKLRAAGVGGLSDRIASLARPSISLGRGNGTGVSKLGGQPDVPVGFNWPMRDPIPGLETQTHLSDGEKAFLSRRAPLSYIGQIDLGALASDAAALPGFPTYGVLYLFYDVVLGGWGFDPNHRNGFEVIWLDASDKDLDQIAPPEEIAEFAPVSLVGRYVLDPIDTETRVFGSVFDFKDPLVETYCEWLDENREYAHRLGGWPNTIQGEMESECALVSNGLKAADTTREVRAILASQKDWVHLLQIESDEDAGMMWGDLGNLYVWIREADLKAKRFEKSWLVLQCS